MSRNAFPQATVASNDDNAQPEDASDAAPTRPLGPDLEAFYRDVYRQELRFVEQRLRRCGVAPADLPDLTHDVFVIVHRRLPDFDLSRPVRPWLAGIVMRAAADTQRLRRRTCEVQKDTWLEREDPGPRPDEAAIQRQARAIAAQVLDQLDPRLRAVLLMHDIGDREARDIATDLGIPLKTVYTRLRLARARFAAAGV